MSRRVPVLPIPGSIRWRLPITYVAIALLAIVASGIVLVLVLRAHFLQQEEDYLRSTAAVFGPQVELLVVDLDADPETLAAQLRMIGFVSQTRLQVYDSRGVLIADSGHPDELSEQVRVSLALEASGLSQSVTQSFEPSGGGVSIDASRTVGSESDAGSPGLSVRRDERISVAAGSAESALEVLRDETGLMSGPQIGADPGTAVGLLPALPQGDARSDLVLQQALRSPIGQIPGVVRFSEAPAVGRDVLTALLWSLAGAGAAAVAVAAVAGWFMSRRLSSPIAHLADAAGAMAAGNLAARARVRRRDELGARGHA